MDGIFELLEQDGYAVIENFLDSNECDVLLQEAITLSNNVPDEITCIFGKNHADQKYFLDSADKISYFFEKEAFDEEDNIKIDRHRAVNKVGHALHWLHPEFRFITYSDRIKDICRRLKFIEPAVVQSMLIYKNSRIGGKVNAHQDSQFLYASPRPVTGFWIPLQDATLDNGCLWFAKGSNSFPLPSRMIRETLPDGQDNVNFKASENNYDGLTFVSAPVKKGSLVLIHGYVVHKSENNLSERSRIAYTFHVVEKHQNEYSHENWLREGSAAPFDNIYETNPNPL